MDGTSPYHSPPRSAWSNQCHGLDIEEGDLITADDHGIDARQELWNIVRSRGVTYLLYVGVHTNWCVSNRPNGLIPMKRLGLATALVRDLTDAWSDPFDGYDRDRPRPEITPDRATELVVEHQERYIQPTVPSSVFPQAVPVRPVMLATATARYSQTGYPVSAAVDGSTSVQTGWGNAGNSRGNNVAVFRTQGPVGEPGGVLLTIVMDFTAHPNHGFGKFRISVATGPEGRSAGEPGESRRGEPSFSWTVLKPESVRALSNGTRFRVVDDGTVLVTATGRPPCDRYVFRARTQLAGIRAFRLETLCDDSLPARGPGLRETNGNFVLGEFSIRVTRAGDLTQQDLRRLLRAQIGRGPRSVWRDRGPSGRPSELVPRRNARPVGRFAAAERTGVVPGRVRLRSLRAVQERRPDAGFRWIHCVPRVARGFVEPRLPRRLPVRAPRSRTPGRARLRHWVSRRQNSYPLRRREEADSLQGSPLAQAGGDHPPGIIEEAPARRGQEAQ